MLTLYKIILIGNINNNIKTQDAAITGILSNLGYLILLIISNETIILSKIATYGLNNPVK